MALGSANPLLLAASGGDSDTVTRSLRWDGGTATRLYNSSISSSETSWTISMWVKRGKLTSSYSLFSLNGANQMLHFDNNDQLAWHHSGSDTRTDSKFRDVSAWMHIAVTNTSGAIRLYVNGTQDTTGGFSSNPTGTSVGTIYIGAWNRYGTSPTYEYDGHIADVHFIDGEVKSPTDFIESNDYGGYKPKEYTGSFGTNGFHLKFDDSSDIGADSTSNSNDFTTTNLSSHDVMLDTPTQNHPTWNPLVNSSNTFSEGNLKVTASSSTPAKIVSTIGASSGKWYAEVLHAGQTNFPLGITADNQERNYLGDSDGNTSISFWPTTTATAVYINGSSVSFSGSGTTWANGDIVGIALNADDKEVSLYKNGSLVGAAVSYSSYNWSEAFFAAGNYISGLVYHANFGQDPTFAGGYTGTPASSEWAYSPPSGFKSLNSSNLTASVTPSEHFDVLTYNGAYDNYMNYSGTSPQTITGTDFTPEIVWIKDRDNVSYNYGNGYHGGYWFDNVMGTGYALNTDLDNGSHYGSTLASGEDGISSFNSNGFTVDEAEETNYMADTDYSYTPDTAERYVAWCWKLGSSGSSSTWASGNTDPDTEKYNASAGVSIIDYYDSVNDETAITLNHSLGAAPEFAIAFDYEGYTSGHYVWHKDLSSGNYLKLHTNSAQSSDTDYFPASPATATTFTLGTSISAYTQSHVALFSGVEGYSKFGKYIGNSSSDGPFVYTGFRPRFLMIKRVNSSDGGWKIMDTARDPHNVVTKNLYAHQSDDEDDLTSHSIDLLSNGFKWRTSGNHENANEHDYIYAAFAESPFKHANAR